MECYRVFLLHLLSTIVRNPLRFELIVASTFKSASTGVNVKNEYTNNTYYSIIKMLVIDSVHI